MDNDKRRNTIIAIVVMVAVVIGLIIFWIVQGVSNSGQTGGEATNTDKVVISTDVSSITKYNFPEKLYKDFSQNFFDAMLVINPACNKPSRAVNMTENGNNISFDIVWCNETYNTELSNDGNNYKFTISKNKEALVNYDSSKKGKAYITPARISKILPMTVKAEGGADVTIKLKDPNNVTELEVGIDSCGSQDKKNKAITAAKAALELSGFNPEEFTYITPDYCDANS